MATLTWLGHSAFRLDTDGGKRIYVDPFLTYNPKTPDSEKEPERVDVIALTHGHGDHVGDTVELSKRFPEVKIVAQVELKAWLGQQGANLDDLPGINKGGTEEIDGVRFTLTNAFHSSGGDDLTYLGEAAGMVVRFDGKSVYFAGDTCVFGDMQLIGRIYAPDVAVLPIGDWYTMGPEEAAVALDLLGNPRCVPCHWGTMALLSGRPDTLAGLTSATVERLEPGDSIDL
ncbi:MAG TPA: metal-dependent hydrolase [Gaiellaceae bacterium]|jgi:L-ascorbate metabolism protein UlaG (beta-lactamase superfamily)|nr:metal-dependent hydrolase [Gaiellaceae bacterium]